MNVYREIELLLEQNPDVDSVVIPKEDLQRMLDSWLAMVDKVENVRQHYKINSG